MTTVAQALAEVKVAEFGAYAAGPHVGKLLANFGARVVHVESRRRPDGFRLEYPPFKDGVPGLDRGGCFAYYNDSKYGVTLDLHSESGLELARRLLAWADIVIENMRPGVMHRLGLGYDAARSLNPGLVMLSSCNMGQSGPRANTPGFGSQLSSLAGFCGLTGAPDGPPMLLYGPYIDFIASTMGAAAVLAGLERRRRIGCGAWIDLSQYEAGLHFIAGALLDFHVQGTVATRNANRSNEAAPHEVYRCNGDRWLALSCWSDAEFARLARAIGRHEWVGDRRFATLSERQAHCAELDAGIAAWCAAQDADRAATLLQEARVHAYPVNNISDLFGDPQLVHRHVWRRRRHRVIGDQAYCFPAFDLSDTPGDITSAAPALGADNETVFREFLGLSAAEYEACQARGAFH
jgi:crotonobetainyl-CoA:carnitine CoA-transferase CaiB-like acyl-CoA transferase